MKTKITTLLLVLIFFLSASTFADDPPSNPTTASSIIYIGPPAVNPETVRRVNGDIMPYFDSFKRTIKNIIDYTLPPWWIGPPEMQPDFD